MEDKTLYSNYLAVNSEYPDIDAMYGMLSKEGFGEYVNGIAGYFKNSISNFVGIFGSVETKLDLRDKKEYNGHVKTLLGIKKTINNVIKNGKMEAVGKYESPVILGLKVDLLTLITSLETGFNKLDKSLETELDELDLYVSNFLSSEDFRRSTRPFKSKSKAYELTNELEKVLSSAIDENGTKDRMKISKLLPNINSLETIIGKMLDVAKHAKVDRMDNVKERIRDIKVKTLAILDTYASKDNEISKQRLGEFSNKLDSVAKLVTVSMSIIYLFNQTVDMTKTVVKIIDENM